MLKLVFIEPRNLLNGLIPDRVHFVEFAELRPKVGYYFCEVEHRSENDFQFCAGRIFPTAEYYIRCEKWDCKPPWRRTKILNLAGVFRCFQ